MLEDFLSGKIGIVFGNENEKTIKQISDILKSKYTIKRHYYSTAPWTLFQQYKLYKRLNEMFYVCTIQKYNGEYLWNDRLLRAYEKQICPVAELLSSCEISISTNDIMSLLNE